MAKKTKSPGKSVKKLVKQKTWTRANGSVSIAEAHNALTSVAARLRNAVEPGINELVDDLVDRSNTLASLLVVTFEEPSVVSFTPAHAALTSLGNELRAADPKQAKLGKVIALVDDLTQRLFEACQVSMTSRF